MDPARSQHQRLRCHVRGAVQGVGFRPFVYRLARENGLTGWVRNTPDGVVLEVEGAPDDVRAFRIELSNRPPSRSRITGLETSALDPMGYESFEILKSSGSEATATIVLPDIATCPECLGELFDPGDRRYRYPFINCTNCGPRYSIIESLPYDRPNTVMRHFEMCPECSSEYHDPEDRRFHAQPNACSKCGPRLAMRDSEGRLLEEEDEALLAASNAILRGDIVAVRGLGGYQLVCDARSSSAVATLRERKLREEKPFALMYPDLGSLQRDCVVGSVEQSLLTSPESPIVLLEKREDTAVSSEVAPGNPSLGVMLPYTPLHHLLLSEVGAPVVATSGNLSEEPICTDEKEALTRLGRIADLFLTHDRGIARHVDDSIVRVVSGRPMVLRRARGYAPMPVELPQKGPAILAAGPMLKNTVGLAIGENAFLSQHIGDLENRASRLSFEQAAEDLQKLYDATPACIACDLHPDYFSTVFATGTGLPTVRVQHHLAHVLSCMAENEQSTPCWVSPGTGPGTVPTGPSGVGSSSWSNRAGSPVSEASGRSPFQEGMLR